MKKLFLLIALMGIVATGCDYFPEEGYSSDYEIWYTSTDGKIAGPSRTYDENEFGAKVLSNNYYGSHGIIKFDDEVTKIRFGFYNCRNLKSIILSNSVASIECYAFAGCISLESITIPNSVTSIGEEAFAGCRSLKSIAIPDSVTKIDSHAFEECSSLESVSLGNGVTEIGIKAFYNCSSLKSVDIPNNVTFIRSQAFWSCEKLETVTLGSGVTRFWDSTFQYCSSLKSVYCKATTPPRIEYDGYWPFDSCASNCKFYVPIESVSAYKDDNYWSHYADNIVGYDF
jgi:hypothetical protein